MKLLFASEGRTHEKVAEAENEDARGFCVGPKNDDLPLRFENASELRQDGLDLAGGEVLHHAEVVNPVETSVLERQLKNRAMPDLLSIRVVSRIKLQSIDGNIEGRDFHPVLNRDIHLPTSAASVEEFGTGRKCPPDCGIQIALDHGTPVDARNDFVTDTARIAGAGPVVVPVLGIGQIGIQSERIFFDEKLLGAPDVVKKQFEDMAGASKRGLGGHFRASVGSGWQADGDLADHELVPVENVEAFKKERIPPGLHKFEDIAGKAVQAIDTERAAGILGEAQHKPCQQVAEAGHAAPEEVPSGEAVASDPARAHRDIAIHRLGQQGRDIRGRVGEIAVESDQLLVLVIIRPLDGLGVGTSDPEFPAAVMHNQAGEFRHEGIQQFTGSVRRVVIHKEDIGIQTEGMDLLHHARGVIPLVVGGDEDQEPVAQGQAAWAEGQSRRNLPNFFRMAGVIGRNPFSFKMRSQASTVKGFSASVRVSTNGKPESVVPKETDVFLGMGFEITDGMLKDLFVT